MAISTTTRKIILDGELVPSPSHRRLLTRFRLLCSGLIRSFSGAPPYMHVKFMAGELTYSPTGSSMVHGPGRFTLSFVAIFDFDGISSG